jgi:hypothetical protein
VVKLRTVAAEHRRTMLKMANYQPNHYNYQMSLFQNPVNFEQAPAVSQAKVCEPTVQRNRIF